MDAPLVTRIPNCSTGATPPSNPLPNDLWFDAVNGYLFIWFNDGDTAQWVVTDPSDSSSKGPPGAPGQQGQQGIPGPIGSPGIDGVDGTSAIVAGPGISAVGAPTTTISIADTPPGSAAQLTGGAYVVDTIAALKAIGGRPLVVITKGNVAPGDGGGGMWRWVPGATTGIDGGMVVDVTTSPAGLYKRVELNAAGGVSGQTTYLKWWPLFGATDHTAFINAALAYGGRVVVPGGANLKISTITMSVPGTVLDLNGGTLTAIAGAGGVMISMTGVGCKVLGPGTLDASASAYWSGVWLQNDGQWLLDTTVVGSRFKPRQPSLPLPVPYYLVSVRDTNDARLLSGCKVNGNIGICGAGGFNLAGVRDSEMCDNWAYDNVPGLGFNYMNTGMPLVNVKINFNRAIGSGYYGHSFANLTSYAVDSKWAVPAQDVYMVGLEARHCAWADWYGAGTDLGSATGLHGKMGMDLTSSNIQRVHCEGKFYNNFEGGIEIKGTGATALSEAGPHFNSIVVKADVQFAMDVGWGVVPCSGNPTAAVTDYRFASFDANVSYIGCPPWVAGYRQEIWSPVKSGGWNWLCLGDVNGLPGVAGATAPTTGLGAGAVSTTTTGTTNAGQPVVTVASATGIAVGMLALTPQGIYAANNSRVIGVSGLNITLSLNWNSTAGPGLTINFVAPAAATVHAATTAAAGQATIVVDDATNVAAGQTVFAVPRVPDGATVVSVNYGTNTVTISTNITTAIPASSVVLFAKEHFDGNLYWRAFEPTPFNAYAKNIFGYWLNGIDSVTLSGNIYNCGYGVVIDGRLSTDSLTTNILLNSLRVKGVGTGIAIGGDTGGTVGVDLNNCFIEADSLYSGNNAAIMVSSQVTSNVRIMGGRFIATPGSYGVRHYTVGPAGTFNLTVDGGAHIGGPVYGIYLDDGKAYNINLRDCLIEGDQPIAVGGSGTFTMSPKCVLKQSGTNNAPGWYKTTGTIAVRGQPLRYDLTIQPLPTTRGNIGEWMMVETPSSTIRGYYVSAANPPLFNAVTWTAFQ